MTERGRRADAASGQRPGPPGEPGQSEEHGPAGEYKPSGAQGPTGEPGGGQPAEALAGPDRKRSPGNLVARILVVLLALTTVVLAGIGAVDATIQGAQAADPAKTAPDRNLKIQMETIRAELTAEVPSGSTVLLRNRGLWGQRLVEFAAMDGIIVVYPGHPADFVLSVVRVPESVSPGGLRLVVTRDR